ncbi:MAG TPA: hypothetical protein VFE58_12375 [Tepidisphaeraceae bacterium]|nr:hypothetical protein [Tepidisphaeraceae bacterium]
MNRRGFVIGGAFVAAALVAGWLGIRRGAPVVSLRQSTGENMFDRVIFVCVNNNGDYSPGVYLQGTGGADGLQLIPQAAPFMRTPETGDAAAGLCGFLFKKIGDGAARDGGLSLYDAPKVGPDGKIDWQAYCAPNVDLILIHVEQGTAELYSGSADLKSPTKSLVRTINGLRFGG